LKTPTPHCPPRHAEQLTHAQIRRAIKRFVTTARRYRTIDIQAGEHTITAADPMPDDLQAALDAIHGTH
jgi:hypothetical protein